MALFSARLRVYGCGLLFARFSGDQLFETKKTGTGKRKIRSIHQRTSQDRKIEMSEKKTIRIVKKGEKVVPAPKPKANSARETARDMVGTVTNWVNEFQQKRRAE